MGEEVFFYGEEILGALRGVRDRDVRRILRVVLRFCRRLGGEPELYKPREGEVVFSCYTEEPLGFYSHEFHGSVGAGYVRITTTRDLAEFKVPGGWGVEVAETEKNVYGFRVAMRYSPELGRWGIKVSPVKLKPPLRLFTPRRRAAVAASRQP